MNVIDLPQARGLAFSCVRAQAVTTLAVAALSLLLGGGIAAMSALVGGGASTAASLAMALVAFGRFATAGAERMLAAFYLGELVKITVVIALLVAALRFMRIAPVAMFAAYVATFLVYWVVLARALLSSGTKPAARR